MPPPPPQAPIPPPKPWPIPEFNLRVEDLSHQGASIFFQSVNPNDALKAAVIASFQWLYTPETAPTNVKAILLVLRPMDGVAYTFGGPSHKEIHFSLDHIKSSASRAKDEILGVITHEVVHCYQYNAKGTCPGGLIEGMADYVRLHAELSPPHWKRSGGNKWDAGYQTTAYFLDWIENRYGDGTVRELNDRLKEKEYDEAVFKDLTGRSVDKLWKLYCTGLKEGEGSLFKVKKDT